MDPRPSEIFEIDDATKVYCENDGILHIGKDIKNYNGIDCGIFRLNQRFFSAMQRELRNSRDSISTGITALIKAQDMSAVYLEPAEQWIDIDTPQAYAEALKLNILGA